MKKYLLSIVIIFFLSIEIKAHVDHYSKYNYLEYELYRNNKLIGYHKYNFKRDEDNLIIDNEVNFKITKLGVDLYKYYAQGLEKYEKGVFSGFKSETNQNKKEKYVNISIDWVFGITIFRLRSYSLQTIANPIPVFPAVPSTIVPPLEISFLLIASSTINNAALSFTDSPGLKYSAFP